MYTAAVITVSDRSYRGEREDMSGPVVKEMLENDGYKVVLCDIVPDEKEKIAEALVKATSIRRRLRLPYVKSRCRVYPKP